MIPIINISSSTVIDDIAAACHDVGAFYISDHGIDSTFLAQFQNMTESYFALPLDEKMRFHISHSLAHRGYFPVGEETAKGSSMADLKEGFDMALDLPETDTDVALGTPLHGPNVYPLNPAGFDKVMVRYYNEMRSLSERLCVIFAQSLKLEPDYFLQYTKKPLAQLRILHYPPQLLDSTEGKPSASAPIGAGAHTDYGIVTIIWQDDVGGLEVLLPNGNWVAALPQKNMFFCNIGDMMQRWTNGYWQATLHRVINLTNKERYSAAFFFDPDYHCEISPIEKFVTALSPCKYSPITMGEYLMNGFDGTFSYRGHTIDNS